MKKSDKETVEEYLEKINGSRSFRHRELLTLGWCAGRAFERIQQRERRKRRRNKP